MHMPEKCRLRSSAGCSKCAISSSMVLMIAAFLELSKKLRKSSACGATVGADYLEPGAVPQDNMCFLVLSVLSTD